MNDNTNVLNNVPMDPTTGQALELGFGSYVDFPPPVWMSKGGTSSNASGDDILRKIVENNATAIIPNSDVGNLNNAKATMKGNRVPYANLFKSNRRAKSDFKLQKMDVNEAIPEVNVEQIDFVEKTFGTCLLGYVISGRPHSSALVDLVRRWGTNIQFQTFDSGWIIFKFPSHEVKTRMLEGGPYMVFGYHLFLKEMPMCFRFREEDMNFVPSWIHIHGLPPDCWNHHVLSTLASYLGTPVHMDMLPHDRKHVKYARVLVEVDISKTKLTEMEVVLPIGKVKVNFQYEHELKPCEHCFKQGHDKDNCFMLKQKQRDGRERQKEVLKCGRSKSTIGRNNGGRKKSWPPPICQHASSSKHNGNMEVEEPSEPILNASSVLDMVGGEGGIGEDGNNENYALESDMEKKNLKTNDLGLNDSGKLDKGKKPMELEFSAQEQIPKSPLAQEVVKPTNAEKKEKKKKQEEE